MARREVDSLRVARLRGDALQIYRAGLTAAEPGPAVRRALARSPHLAQVESSPSSRVWVLALGKAALAMTRAALAALRLHDLVPAGVVAVVDLEHAEGAAAAVEVFVGGHPAPNLGSLRAAARMEDMLAETREGDTVVVLISGGGSALLSAPTVSLADKVAITNVLLQSGAAIDEVNTVRKHLSRVKGGGLARWAHPAAVVAILVSDVPEDDPAVIASGPVTADPTTFADALAVLARYGITGKIPAVRDYLERGAAGLVPETPTAEDPTFRRVTTEVVLTNQTSVRAMAEKAREMGYEAVAWQERLAGEAREAGDALALQLGAAGAGKSALLLGGETTVTVLGDGVGGRCQEMALAFALSARDQLAAPPAWVFLSAGTDGRDGRTEAAGALVDPHTLSRLAAAGVDPEKALSQNASGAALAAASDLVVTGPTGTNVADLQVLLQDSPLGTDS